jgi:hypothetical protein
MLAFSLKRLSEPVHVESYRFVPVPATAGFSLLEASRANPGIFPQLIVLFADLSFCAQSPQEIMHHLDVRFVIRMGGNIGYVMNLS